jgi:hypothetical protein
MKSLSSAALVGLACGLAACGSGHNAAQPATNGQVHFSAQTRSHQAATSTGTAPLVCATFSLQPFSLDAAGTETLAGSPVTLTSTAASQTDAILGCIDQGASGPNPNWGYQITAMNFVDCSSGLAIPGLSPQTSFTNATVQCTAGLDVSLPINVDVSIATPNAAGYIDITVGVTATDVQTGCKNADYAPGGTVLHFGESNIDPKGGIAQGLIGLDLGAPQQWNGSILAGAAPALDTYYTGSIDTSLAPTSLVYQTFISSSCASGAEYADVRHAQCVTTLANGAPSTLAALADAFVESPNGFAAASVAAGQGSIDIYSDYALAPTLVSDANVPVNNFSTGTGHYTVSLAAPDTFTGVFVDPSALDSLAVTGSIGGVPSAATLTFVSGAWTLGAWKPLSAANAAQIACHGIFAAPSGCITPQACPSTKVDCTAATYDGVVKNLEASCPGTSQLTIEQMLNANSAEFCRNNLDAACVSQYEGYVKEASTSIGCTNIQPVAKVCSLGAAGCACLSPNLK